MSKNKTDPRQFLLTLFQKKRKLLNITSIQYKRRGMTSKKEENVVKILYIWLIIIKRRCYVKT